MLNKVMLIGNVGKDPEIRHLDSGIATTTIPLATSETYTDRTSGERITQTEWHNVVLWRNLAELAEKYIRKGTQIYVEGKIRSRSWDDKEGQRRYTTEIVAETVRLLSRRDDSNTTGTATQPSTTTGYTAASNAATPASPASPVIDESDDLPF